MLSFAKRYPARGAAALLLLLIWYSVAFYVRLARQAEFPLPQETATAFLRLLANQDKILDHSLYAHLGASLERWFMGYTAGVAWGLGLGLAGAMLPGMGRTLAPLISVIHLIPGLAWIPIAILLVGINQRTAILLISLTAMPPVVLSLQQGLKATPEEFIMLSRMCGEGPGRRFFKVQLPAALPHLITGLRLALANSWRVVVASEMVVGTGLGLGYTIMQSRWTLDYTTAFICIGLIVVCGLLAEHGFFGMLEKVTLRRWGMSR